VSPLTVVVAGRVSKGVEDDDGGGCVV